jgi:CRISPR/Cas system CMR-associated protein Cmr5 small subunit
MNIDDSFSTPTVNFPIVSSIKKKTSDANKKFEESWATKLPWAKFCLGSNGSLHVVKCKICNEVKGKDKILATKWDSLCKHVGR